MPPPPKNPANRQRRNKVSTAATLEAGPALRVDLPTDATWKAQTVAWWETIWASPMVDEWVAADVPGLLMLAALVDQFWTDRDSKVAAEIRMQQREYGLSPLSRRSLQWTVKPVTVPVPTVAPTKARDPRLRAVV